jgi:rod shape-determining protein MreD
VRWIVWTCLGLLVVSMQTTLAPHVQIGVIRPDWPFLLVVALALAAPKREALVGALLIGLFVDLCTVLPLGTFTVVYGLAAQLIVLARELLFRDALLTHVALTFTVGALVQFLIALLRLFQDGAEQYAGSPLWEALGITLYTTLWSVPGHWLFLRARRWLGLGRRDQAAYRAL